MTIRFALVGDTAMVELNHQWFGKNEPTDVISFPMQEKFDQHNFDKTSLAGEIVIDVDEVWRNAQTYGVDVAHELARVMAHGTLHLLGYTDDTPERKSAMKAIEDAVVNEVHN